MSAQLIAKARANRLAALEAVSGRKGKLVSLNDFRTDGKRAASPLKGFVSSRATEDKTIAA